MGTLQLGQGQRLEPGQQRITSVSRVRQVDPQCLANAARLVVHHQRPVSGVVIADTDVLLHREPRHQAWFPKHKHHFAVEAASGALPTQDRVAADAALPGLESCYRGGSKLLIGC